MGFPPPQNTNFGVILDASDSLPRKFSPFGQSPNPAALLKALQYRYMQVCQLVGIAF